ncbi:hypothetical protein TCDM_07224 [Trypanosoma cruzi Dm28c]|uniref:Uncharacterized protein n=1 Tax=Trypanosoma cruzi Dm28c TaxID=1416333 RepID=V5DB24_TRYCR|nr:hypothetical protein TCDM_07224 [Trypanosoma cruzi Dm28c]
MTGGGDQQQGEETADDGMERKRCSSPAASGLFDMPREPPVYSSPNSEKMTPTRGADARTHGCVGNSCSGGEGGGRNAWQPPRLEDFAGPFSGVFSPEAAVKMTDVSNDNDCRGSDEGSLLAREVCEMFTALPDVPAPASSKHVTQQTFESGVVTTSKTGCSPRVEQKESYGLQLNTGPSSATSRDPNQQFLRLLKGRQRREAGHTSPRSSIRSQRGITLLGGPPTRKAKQIIGKKRRVACRSIFFYQPLDRNGPPLFHLFSRRRQGDGV